MTAAVPCLVLYLPYDGMLRPSGELSAAHWKLLQNWLETISGKYFSLDCRLELLCCKSLRGRICLWLLEQRAYLNCDRSALSRELSRMQEDGLIELFRSTFKLPDPERLANEM